MKMVARALFTAWILPLSLLSLVTFPRYAQAQSQPCNTSEELAPLRNKYICPVVGGGEVRRDPDRCASTGGTLKSLREGNRLHNALDINAKEGTKVVASKPGRADIARDWGKMGKTVVIDHGDGDYSIYGHLQTITVKEGACLKAGAGIGTVGYTGNGKCLKDKGLIAHLHFAILRTAKLGLAQRKGPIEAAIQNAEDWLEISQEYFQGDILDLGIKDPEVMLQNESGCLK